MVKTIGGRQLEAEGFRVVKEVVTTSGGPGKWFEAIDPDGEAVCMLRIGPGKWHSFFKELAATGSRHTPRHALTGGLGDVIDTDSQLRSYCRIVLSAPERLSREYEGLYAAGSSCYAEYRR